MKKLKFLGVAVVALVAFAGCNNIVRSDVAENDVSSANEVIIGDEVIYGDSFSLNRVFTEPARAAGFEDEELDTMVYFSVCPTKAEAVHLINDTMGYLNPIEMNREILQTCDSESLIFKDDTEITETTDADDMFRLGIKYYYVETKDFAESVKDTFENYEVLDEFYMPKVNELEEDPILEKDSPGARWLWDKFEVCGTIKYAISGKTIPAYGIKVRRTFGDQTTTDKNGYFSIGKRAKGLYCWLWADYYNDACSLSNVAGINASTMLKSGFPKALQNVTIRAESEYATAKLAICNELFTRYENEKKLHSVNIPKAIVWTTQAGNGTSSAPCFKLRKENSAPDIFISGCKDNTYKLIQIIHHEYMHYLHVIYTGNKNNFWDNVVNSEINSSIRAKLSQFIGKFQPYYDFSNQYVCFTENLAEWYNYEGLKNGPCAVEPPISKRYGSSYRNVSLFNYIKDSVKISSSDIIKLIDDYDIVTFQEFYNALIRKYPSKKSVIQSCFRDKYVSYGNAVKF
ncbi:MAG: hypothetical protein IJ530_15800 [Treponema sp.]|uniref:hypothetical protein n=1 Tax=Treponema sp. TaxID=166 RepID=UPI0025D76939|nr:hypothetical protein [Treponema sp.]MBQ8681196.1 hypothetical protein [Treponema sp.]